MSDGAIVVLGLGNVIMSDEGVGVHVIRRLLDDPRLPHTARLIDGGTLGLELLSIASDAELLLVVDAVDLGLKPGSLVRLGPEELFGIDRGASAHELGVADLLSALRLLGAEPGHVVLLGVQPDRVELGTDLSPGVGAAVDRLLDEILAEISAWEARAEVVCSA
ncbi:MAG TPA: HyaD/HybD family hydrogenase maturation endopeptidase [Chloroflexota bacterium]|nr:HyaD/HybD family hydrogenase maturation endopeptidase [Chloroflexota bacterium]